MLKQGPQTGGWNTGSGRLAVTRKVSWEKKKKENVESKKEMETRVLNLA